MHILKFGNCVYDCSALFLSVLIAYHCEDHICEDDHGVFDDEVDCGDVHNGFCDHKFDGDDDHNRLIDIFISKE